MPRLENVTSAEDFRRIYSEGRRAAVRGVVAHVRDSGADRPARVGVTTSRGLAGSVRRNRSRRVLREAARRLRPRLKRGVDVVLVATAQANTLAFQELADSAARAVADAGGLDG